MAGRFSPRPNQHQKGHIRPPVILQAMLGCTLHDARLHLPFYGRQVQPTSQPSPQRAHQATSHTASHAWLHTAGCKVASSILWQAGTAHVPTNTRKGPSGHQSYCKPCLVAHSRMQGCIFHLMTGRFSPRPNQHQKGPIRPPVILQAMLGCTLQDARLHLPSYGRQVQPTPTNNWLPWGLFWSTMYNIGHEGHGWRKVRDYTLTRPDNRLANTTPRNGSREIIATVYQLNNKKTFHRDTDNNTQIKVHVGVVNVAGVVGKSISPNLERDPVFNEKTNLDIHLIQVLLQLLIGPDLCDNLLLQPVQLCKHNRPRDQQGHAIDRATRSTGPRDQQGHVIDRATWTTGPRERQGHVNDRATWSTGHMVGHGSMRNHCAGDQCSTDHCVSDHSASDHHVSHCHMSTPGMNYNCMSNQCVGDPCVGDHHKIHWCVGDNHVNHKCVSDHNESPWYVVTTMWITDVWVTTIWLTDVSVTAMWITNVLVITMWVPDMLWPPCEYP